MVFIIALNKQQITYDYTNLIMNLIIIQLKIYYYIIYVDFQPSLLI